MNKKYMVALIINIFPFFMSCLLYDAGIAIIMIFPILQILINLLNYKWAKKVISYLFLNILMLISSITSIKIIIQLYYNYISSDTETLAVGSFAAMLGVVFILIMTLTSIICRIISKKNLTQ